MATVGMKDHGKNPGKAADGNQDIGKITARVIDGIKANGSDKSKEYKNRKAPQKAGLLNKSRLISAVAVVISLLEITTAAVSVSTTASTFFAGLSY